MKFDGRVVVVTGGASGIGAACAEMLAARGALVVVADKNRQAADETAARIGAHAVALDVGDETSVREAEALVRERFGAASALVNIASVAGMRSGPLHSYGPAKAGVIHLGECLAAEWGHAGVRVNTVSPGFTRTPALQRGIEKKTLAPDAMIGASAMGRLVEPSEIAAAVCFLISDLASGITGVNLPVDVGYLVATPWDSYGGLRRV